jgi:outer membrane protein, heavy metal efflux system
MRPCRAALAAAISLMCASALAQHGGTLSLDEALSRTSARHPDLARYHFLRDGAHAALDEAIRRPGINAEIEVENAPAIGGASAIEAAEVTLSLASVLERGGKLEARRALADVQIQALDLEEEARRIDLLAEVARRYLDLLALQELAGIADDEIGQREGLLDASARRVRAGASPESVTLAAEAAVARSRVQRERLRSEMAAAAHRLAILWKDRTPDFERVAGDLVALPVVPPLESLLALAEGSPEVRRFADEARLREARVQLARTTRSADIDWQAGVRRLEDTDSWAAVVGVSVPLSARRRAEPRVRATEAELATISLERESAELTLVATLTEAHSRLSVATLEVEGFRTEILPKLAQAEAASERAYRAGALSYIEWAQVQSDAMSARREQLQAAIEAHRALIEIQRLTGSPFTGADAGPASETQP